MRLRALALTLGTLLVATACSSGGSDKPAPAASPSPSVAAPTASASPTLAAGGGLDRFYRQKLAWTGCGDGFQCARLTVPLDYARPAGATISIAVVRLPASGKKIGSVVLNPGGPGGSGIDYARAARSVVTDRLRRSFDVVGFDPRGVGESAPVRCLPAAALDSYTALDASPDTPAEHAAMVDASRGFAQGCESKAARLLPHVGTVDAARDMDVLRAALGDKRLTYLGKSYGTFLGALYANLFPTHVRALVLDGAVDPTLSGEELNRVQAHGFEVALQAFIADCVRRSSCALGSSVAAASSRLDRLIADADARPLPAPNDPSADGRVVTQAEVVLGIATALYSRGNGWPVLRYALSGAVAGDGSVLLQLADSLVDRKPDGSYSNQTESNVAINCLDRPEPRDVAAYDRDAAAFAKQSPHFGAFIAYGSLPCAFWPVPAVTRPGPLHAKGAPPILVVGTTRDPATPYSWAQGLARQLDSGVLLTYRGDGHTVYGLGVSCIDTVVDDYLIAGKVPRAGTTC